MTEENEQKINNLIIDLEKYPEEFLKSAQRVLEAGNSNMYALDFVANAVNNRAISLVNGFITLIKSNNYLTAVSLIRLQLDNALRFFASTLVENSHKFAEHFIDGKPIRDYKDAFGKNLTDNYLSKKLDSYFPGTEQLYKSTCAHIHLSDSHFIPTLTKYSCDKSSVEIVIGNSSNFKFEEKIDFISTMIEVSKLVIIVIEQWKHEKNRLSKIIDKQNKHNH